MSSDEIRDLVLANATEVDSYKYTLDMNTAIYYDHNVPVSIVLPPEAEDAIDFDDLLDMRPEINQTDPSAA